MLFRSLSALPDGQGVRLELSDSKQTRSDFPFEFLLQLDYRLAPGALEVSMTLQMQVLLCAKTSMRC